MEIMEGYRSGMARLGTPRTASCGRRAVGSIVHSMDMLMMTAALGSPRDAQDLVLWSPWGRAVLRLVMLVDSIAHCVSHGYVSI